MNGIPDIAQALGIPPRACEQILREEGASPTDAQEALRRILRHKAYQAGTIRSPGAFFRGVLRRVQDDRQALFRRPLPPPPPPLQNAQPASPLGRAYLRAYHLLASGHNSFEVTASLRQNFPDASAELLAEALSWAINLHHADRSQEK